jgi:pimeloyl-ACP methyl ester carboxylesterase
MESENIHLTSPRSVLLVHGAWHGAWCWEPWIDDLKSRGFTDIRAVELQGHGMSSGSVRRARLKDYIADVKQVLSEMDEEPILIGHSLGCTILQHVASEKTYRNVVLLAPIPVPSVFRKVFIKQILRHPLITLKCVAIRNMSPWVTSNISARLFFGKNMPRSLASNYMRKMQGESFKMFLLDLVRKVPAIKKTNVLLVAANNDSFFSVKSQHVTADTLGADFAVLEGSGHDIMLDINRDSAANIVVKWLNQKS